MSKNRFSLALAVFAALGVSGGLRAEPVPLPAPYAQIDADGNGVVTEAEYLKHAVGVAKAEFQKLDRDGNGSLQADEAGAGIAARAAKPAREAGALQRVFSGNEAQSEALRKRVSAGPSMRQGGR